jgi:1-acyl-sn-glycerol-3-phosphate acyltransferase
LSETARNLRMAAQDPVVFRSMLGISWMWFFGAVFLSQFPSFAKSVLHGDEQVASLLLVVFSVGVGAGALLCERLSRLGAGLGLGLVPVGAAGMSVFALDLFFATPLGGGATLIGAAEFLARAGSARILFDLVMIGVFGGFYIVPLYALIQTRSERSHQSRIIAGNNILNALFMVASAALSALLLYAGYTIPQIFLAIGLLNALVAVYIYTLVPEFLMRFLIWLLMHTVYRLEKRGLENIPDEGAALIVCNHVSFVDALIIVAASRRPIRFVMDHQIFRMPVLSFIFRTGRMIPIAPRKENPLLLERAYEEIDAALRAGDLVGIFPEGRLTDTGDLYPFKPGVTRILARTPVPVVPLALRGLWGSFFSRIDGRAMSRPARLRPWRKVALVGGDVVAPAQATPEFLQQTVHALRGDWR